MITRSRQIKEIIRRLRNFDVVAILGPRQIGKTTLAKQVADHYRARCHHFDLEDPAALSRLQADANLALRNLKGLIVIDEVQRLSNLFPLLRVLSDRRPRPARFLVLGSAAPDLLRQSRPSLWQVGSRTTSSTVWGLTKWGINVSVGVGCAAAFRRHTCRIIEPYLFRMVGELCPNLCRA